MSLLVALRHQFSCVLTVKSKRHLCANFDFSQECERKDSAELFPKNFALIRLAEKTIKKLIQDKENAAKLALEQEAKAAADKEALEEIK